MKRVILIFLLLTTMVFAEEKDEVRELREKVIRLETVIQRMESEEEKALNHYEKALEDSKEIYSGAIENNDNSLEHVYWFVGGAGAFLLALLGFLKIDSDKKLKEEKNEIKESNARDLKDLKDENRKLLDEIIKLEEKLSLSFRTENEKLNEKIKKIDESIKKIDEQMEEVRDNYIKTKISSGIAQVLSKDKDEEKYSELKKLEDEVREYPEEYKESLYFQIAYFSNDLNEQIDYSSRAIRLDPNNLKSYIIKGIALFKIEDFERAIKNYTEAINLNSHISIFYCKRAELFIKKGQLDEAFKDLIKDVTRGDEGEFSLNLSQEKYDEFLKFIEGKPNRTGLENEILRRVEKKEGINIVG